MQMLAWKYTSSDKTWMTLPLHTRYTLSNGKSMVHNTLVLTAADQLRQRMAWALSEVFIIGKDGLGKEDQMEPWLAYYECAATRCRTHHRMPPFVASPHLPACRRSLRRLTCLLGAVRCAASLACLHLLGP